MAKEIELKLAIPAQASDLLKQHRVLQQARSYDSKDLINIYFDTDNLDLNRARVALRVRKAGDQYIQTLKTAGNGSGGLHQRGEWEWIVKGPELELEHIDPSLWPAPLDADYLAQNLKPAFETNFTRKKWLLDVSFDQMQAEIEMVLDNGAAIACEHRDSISEIELELISGDSDLLFKIAHDLSDTIPLQLSNISKAQRGYRLFAPQVAGARANRVPPFDDYTGLVTAAQIELDHFIAARDILSFDRNWLNLESLYESLLQLRWCCYHLNRSSVIDKALKMPTYLSYKLRMFTYNLEHLVNIHRQSLAWQRLDSCPKELQCQADFALLNSQYHAMTNEPWMGQSMLEVMQWLHILSKEDLSSPFHDNEVIFQGLLSRVQLPLHPTDKILWLKQASPLLHLIRWVNYQNQQQGLGTKHLIHEANLLVDLINELGGLMSEELAIQNMIDQGLKVEPTLLTRNQKDQYDKALELGRIALSFNTLKKNLQTH